MRIDLAKYAKDAEKLVADNSPGILAAVAVVGTVTTAYLAGKASFKAAEILKDEERAAAFYSKIHTEQRVLTFKDKVRICWKLYIPTVSTGLLTVTCIVGSNTIGTRRTAAMAAAYSLSDRAFTDYRAKVYEKFGENKERQVRDEVAQEHVNRSVPSCEVLIGDGSVLCFDLYSGRYFQSSMEEIKKAQNDTNYEILHNSYCSLGDFYSRLGLPGTKYSEEVGWSSDHLLEILFSTVLSDDGKPCLAIDYGVRPVRGYNIFGYSHSKD